MSASKRLETVTKWRQVFCMMATSGQTGFERYVRDRAEAQILHRAEISAIASLLIQKGVFTALEMQAQTEIEAEELDTELARRFPGFTASALGMILQQPEAHKTMMGWQNPYGMAPVPKEPS